MFFKTTVCRQKKENAAAHGECYTLFLQRSLQRQRQTGPVSYNKIISKNTVATTTMKHRALVDDSGDGLTKNLSPEKETKRGSVIQFTILVYRCFLGHVASVTRSATTSSSVSNFLPKHTLHKKLVTALFCQVFRST